MLKDDTSDAKNRYFEEDSSRKPGSHKTTLAHKWPSWGVCSEKWV